MDYSDSSTFSTASGKDYQYVVLQVTLKEKFLGTGSGNLTELEDAINHQTQKGYRLHTITTSNGGSKGLMGGDRIQATMVFEKIVKPFGMIQNSHAAKPTSKRSQGKTIDFALAPSL